MVAPRRTSTELLEELQSGKSELRQLLDKFEEDLPSLKEHVKAAVTEPHLPTPEARKKSFSSQWVSEGYRVGDSEASPREVGPPETWTDGKPEGWSPHADVVVENLGKRFPRYSREDIMYELASANYHGGVAERRLSGKSSAGSRHSSGVDLEQPPDGAEAILETLASRFPQYDRKTIAEELVQTNYHGGQAISRLNEKAALEAARSKPADWPEHADGILETLSRRLPGLERSVIISELVSTNYHGGQALSRLEAMTACKMGKTQSGTQSEATTCAPLTPQVCGSHGFKAETDSVPLAAA